MPGHHTIAETEKQVVTRLANQSYDFESMAVVSNIFRAANAVRNHLERTVLLPHNLTWTGFVVLWVVWIWEPIETKEVAVEAGIAKATVTGVLNTLEGRGLVKRARGLDDRRQMFVTLTPEGRRLMKKLFPDFNKEESNVTGALSSSQKNSLAKLLRTITATCESQE